MDYVPSMAAVAAAAQKSPQVDATALAVAKAVSPVEPTALDPRPTYTLAPGTADAMLSLADAKAQAVGAVEFETRYGHASKVTEEATAVATAAVVAPEPTKAVSASNRNWNEDVRLDHIPTRKVGTDTVVQYDTPRVMAAWSTAFPDIARRKFRGLNLADTNVKLDKVKAWLDGGQTLLAKEIYLVSNDENYRIFSQTHPQSRIHWTPVDSDEILLFWPNDAERDEARGSSAPTHGSAETEEHVLHRPTTSEEVP